MKKIPARFFVTDSGEEPVRTWLKTLSIDDRKVIGKDIQRLNSDGPLVFRCAGRLEMVFGKCGVFYLMAVRRAFSLGSPKAP